ncbi:MAG: YceD family protein [Lysobacterales bacterium]|jgi:uncharacterized protein
MSREYPDWISPARAAEGKRVFSGTIPLGRMRRLVPLLAEVKGEAHFTARFGVDMEKRVVIDLQVTAALPLECQASLEVYDEQVQRQTMLAVVESERDQDDLPEHYEPVKTENGRLALASLVEDELLLGLPQVARRPGLEWIEYSTGAAEPGGKGEPGGRKENPFAALKDMLEQDKQD